MENFEEQIMIYAKKYLEHGISAVPCLISKERKYPNYAWKKYQKRLMSPKEFKFVYYKYKCNGIGFICGSISGNIEVLDFDNKNAPDNDFYQNYLEIFKKEFPEIFDNMIIIKTINNGYHWIYKTDGLVKGNSKLARCVNKETLIETRGEGGFVAAMPSMGYELIHGSFKKIVILKKEEYEFVHQLAKQFDNSLNNV